MVFVKGHYGISHSEALANYSRDNSAAKEISNHGGSTQESRQHQETIAFRPFSFLWPIAGHAVSRGDIISQIVAQHKEHHNGHRHHHQCCQNKKRAYSWVPGTYFHLDCREGVFIRLPTSAALLDEHEKRAHSAWQLPIPPIQGGQKMLQQLDLSPRQQQEQSMTSMLVLRRNQLLHLTCVPPSAIWAAKSRRSANELRQLSMPSTC